MRHPLTSRVPARSLPLRSLWIRIGALALTGCFDLRPPPLPPPRDATVPFDAPGPPRVLAIEAVDARGEVWPDGAIPRAAEIRIHATAAIDPGAVFLLAGSVDDDLRDDLETTPLRAATLARSWPHERAIDGATIVLRPALLDRGAAIVVAIGAWARDASGRALGAPVVAELRAARDDAAGARAVEAWPPDAASAIGASLPLAAIRFDGSVESVADAVWIAGPDGVPVPSIARGARCDEIGWPDGVCAVIVPSRPLAPGAAHALRTGDGLRDATGAIVPAFVAAFTTSLVPDVEPPSLRAPACAIDEVAIDGLGCVLADDAHLELRIVASEPVRLRLEHAARRLGAVAPRGEARIALEDLGASAIVPIVLEAIDAAGNATRLEVELATTEPLAAISIDAVRADPHGAEPRQEYVEVRNHGAVAVDLEGYALSDAAAGEGDRIVGSHLLAPGASALIVGSEFDPDDRGDGDRDAVIPPGLALVRVDRSIGSGGLSNAGEPLFLRDPAGRRVSAAPAQPTPREGVCLVRATTDLRTGAIGSFEYDPGGGCTPGRRP